MTALVVTITREPWPDGLLRHWHLVDTHLSRHIVTAVQRTYGRFATVTELSWEGSPPICPTCKKEIN